MNLERHVLLYKVICLLYNSIVVISRISNSLQLFFIVLQLGLKLLQVELFGIQVVYLRPVVVHHVEALDDAALDRLLGGSLHIQLVRDDVDASVQSLVLRLLL